MAKKARKSARSPTKATQDLGSEIARERETAIRFHRRGGFQKAAAVYRRILDRSPNDPEALHRLGLLAHRAGQSETAVKLLQRALASKLDYAEVRINLGAILQTQGKLTEAADCYQQALAIAPGYAVAHNNLGLMLKDQCRLDEATARYQRALRIDPNYADAHNNLGVVLQRQGKLDQALVHFRRALAINPKSAATHANLGNLLKDQDSLDEAVACYQRALAIDPNLVDAHNNLGIVLKNQGKLDEAIACYQRALAIDPNLVDAHNNLGVVLQHQGKLDEAFAQFRGALAINPNDETAHNNLGSALKARGRFDEAAAEYEKALAIEPSFAWPYLGLVALKEVQPDDDIIPRMERLLRDRTPSDKGRAHLNFALGKCFDDIGEFDKAFHHYQAGNEIRKASQPFDAAAFAEKTDRIIATFTRAFFEQRKSLGSEAERPIFIIGMPRSGTTLVEQIIASHPDVFGAGELSYFALMVAKLPAALQDTAAYPECAALIDEATAGRLAQEYLNHLRERSDYAVRVTDKMPNNFRHLGLIAFLFPRARIMHCQRDPLDVCLSCYFQDFLTQPFSYDLTNLGRYYREYNRLMAHWSAVLQVPVLDVRYEELITDTEAVSRRMIAFCGLDWDDTCLASHKNDRPIYTMSDWQARQPVYDTSIERWRRYERHLEPLKRALERVA